MANCSELLQVVTGQSDDADEAGSKKGFFRGLGRLFSGSEDQESDSTKANLPYITAMSVFNPLQPRPGQSHYGVGFGQEGASSRVAESHDMLALGFSNGALLIYDTFNVKENKEDQIVYKNLTFNKGKKAIDSLRTCTFQICG